MAHHIGRWLSILGTSGVSLFVGGTAFAQAGSNDADCTDCCTPRLVDTEVSLGSRNLAVVLLLDNSPSMKATWASVTKEDFSNRFLTSLRSRVGGGYAMHLGAAVFPEGPAPGPLGCRPPTASAVSTCQVPTVQLVAGAGPSVGASSPVNRCSASTTPLADTLLATANALRPLSARKVVVVVTDGRNNCQKGHHKASVDTYRGSWSCSPAVLAPSDPRAVLRETCDPLARLMMQGVSVHWIEPVAGSSNFASLAPLQNGFRGGRLTSGKLEPEAIAQAVRTDLCRLRDFAFASGAELRQQDQAITPRDCDEGDAPGYCVEPDGGIRLLGKTCEAFLGGKPVMSRRVLEPPAEGGSSSSCRFDVLEEPEEQCKGGKRYTFQICRPDCVRVGKPWVICPSPPPSPVPPPTKERRTVVQARPLENAWTCPGGGSLLVSCTKSVDDRTACAEADADFEVSPVCFPLGTGPAHSNEPPPTAVEALEPLATTNPGDPSSFRLRLGASRGLGFALGVRPFRALREAGARPFYNRPVGWVESAMDSLELSYGFVHAHRLPTRAGVQAPPLHTFGLGVDFLEVGQGRAPGSAARHVAECVRGRVLEKSGGASGAFLKTESAVGTMKTTGVGSRGAAFEIGDIIRDCTLAASHWTFGSTLVLDFQESTLAPTQLHLNAAVAHGPLFGPLRASGQLGGNAYLGDDVVETIGAGLGRSSVGGQFRVDVALGPFTPRMEGGILLQGRAGRAIGVGSFGGAIDALLPLGVVLRVGLKYSAYDGRGDAAGFVNLGVAYVNWDERHPAKYFLEHRE